MIETMIFVIVGFIGAILISYFLLIAIALKKVKPGKALVRTGLGTTRVSMKSIWVIPFIHNAEEMDITLKQLTISREGKDGLISKDNLKVDFKITFFVRVNPTDMDIRMVAQTVGCARTSDPELLKTLFEAKFAEAIKTVGKRFNFDDLYKNRKELKQEILKEIGDDLNGFSLDDCVIDYLEQPQATR